MLDEFITTDIKEIKAFNVNMEKIKEHFMLIVIL